MDQTSAFAPVPLHFCCCRWADFDKADIVLIQAAMRLTHCIPSKWEPKTLAITP